MASDIALEVIGDFAVVCLLSPKCSFKQRPKSGLSRAISGLPGHAFQVKICDPRPCSFMHPMLTCTAMLHNDHRQSWNVAGLHGIRHALRHFAPILFICCGLMCCY